MITTEKILLKYSPTPENILPALKEISAAFGYLSEKEAAKTADYFSLPLSKIYETATFYEKISVRKNPALVIKICSSTNCVLKNSLKIIKEIENVFRIKSGAADSKIKLVPISCLGSCGDGPVMIVNDKVYTNVSVSSVHAILQEYL